MMNYFTIKKSTILALATAFAVSASAQETTTTTSTVKPFGGRAQFRTWTFGINAGVTVPSVVVGGTNDYGRSFNPQKWTNGDYAFKPYYGFNVRKQFGHIIGLQFAANRGDVNSRNAEGVKTNQVNGAAYEGVRTQVQYDVNIQAYFNLATIDYMDAKNTLNIFATVGTGFVSYNPVAYNDYEGPVTKDFKGTHGDEGDHNYARTTYLPVGVGAKLKVSDRVALAFGYEMKFLDTDVFDATDYNDNTDKFGYTHAGLEFSLGSKAKPDLNWVNPIKIMYDDLKDPALKQEVEALKGRVSNLEQSVEDMKKDSDGDGVADYLDKCPDSPAGAKIDGSGCEMDSDGDGVPDWKDKCPNEKGSTDLNGCPEMGTATMTGVDNIQFEYNSSVLKTSSYSTLDNVSSSLRSDKSTSLKLDGHASAEGTDEYNMQLSLDRANAVKTYLVNSGVDSKRISTQGHGETRPIASNTTEAGRNANRRVEFRKL